MATEEPNTYIPAGRQDIEPGLTDRASRIYWEAEADNYQHEHGSFLGGVGGGFVWGPEGVSEQELGLLGPPGGRRVLEVGSGAGQCGRWLEDRGDTVVILDIALAQLRHARGMTAVAASAERLPFADNSFDVAFSSFGAVPFVADIEGLFAEVRRVLRPGGLWAFSSSHPIRWAFPDEPDDAGLTATFSYFNRKPYVERDDYGDPVYVEHHRTMADLVNALIGAGFKLGRMVEPEWPLWNLATWGGWSPLRGELLPGTLIISATTP